MILRFRGDSSIRRKALALVSQHISVGNVRPLTEILLKDITRIFEDSSSEKPEKDTSRQACVKTLSNCALLSEDLTLEVLDLMFALLLEPFHIANEALNFFKQSVSF